MPTLSVIIPTYNRAQLVTRAIESILAQTEADWDLLVVDGGSTDGTQAMVQEYVRKDRRIHLVKGSVNGPAHSRNTGIRLAEGAYIAFLDDDDAWLPEKLATQVRFMEAHPEVGLSYTYAAGRTLSNGTPDPQSVYGRPIRDAIEDLLNWPNFISTSAVMIRRECLKEAGGFDTRYELCEDFDLWLRLAQRWPIAALEEVLTIHGARDGRPQLALDQTQNYLAAIRVLKNLQLTPATERYHRRRQRHIARLHYSLARDLIDLKRYGEAGRHFLAALVTDPLVGTMVRRPGEKGLALAARVVKPYLSAPWCLVKGLR